MVSLKLHMLLFGLYMTPRSTVSQHTPAVNACMLFCICWSLLACLIISQSPTDIFVILFHVHFSISAWCHIVATHYNVSVQSLNIIIIANVCTNELSPDFLELLACFCLFNISSHNFLVGQYLSSRSPGTILFLMKK